MRSFVCFNFADELFRLTVLIRQAFPLERIRLVEIRFNVFAPLTAYFSIRITIRIRIRITI